MVAKIKTELSVGLTQEIEQGLKTACEFEGSKPSQYARQAVAQRLVREGFLQHPMQRAAAGAK